MHELAHLHFADAETSYADARYVLFGVPYDGTTSFRPGARFGPRAIREASFNFESYDPSTGLDLYEIPFTDLGDLGVLKVPEDLVGQVADVTGEIVGDGKVPVMLGGEHTATIGAVSAMKPDVYVVCDAHLDLRDELDGTPYSHGCVTRRILDLGVDDVVIIGARSGIASSSRLRRRGRGSIPLMRSVNGNRCCSRGDPQRDQEADDLPLDRCRCDRLLPDPRPRDTGTV